MHDLSGRRALFVAGSSAIGLASARLFHSLGATVILAGRSAARLEAARQALGNASSVETVAFDFAETGQVDEALAQLWCKAREWVHACAARLRGVQLGRCRKEPINEIQACRGIENPFAGAATCPAHSGPSSHRQAPRCRFT